MDISWDYFRLKNHLSCRDCKTLGCRLQTRGLAETIRAAKWNSCLKPLQLCRQYFSRGYVSYPGDKCLAILLHLQNVLYTGYSVIRLYSFDCVTEEGFLVGITHLSCRIGISLPMTCLFLPVLGERRLRSREKEEYLNQKWVDRSKHRVFIFLVKKTKPKTQAKYFFFLIAIFPLTPEGIRR